MSSTTAIAEWPPPHPINAIEHMMFRPEPKRQAKLAKTTRLWSHG